MKEKLYVIKIGGNIIDDEALLGTFLKHFREIDGKKVLVHGGGKLATKLASELQIPQQMIDGRRITDAETLKIVVMVYAGLVNKKIVAQLKAEGCEALGISGADASLIKAVRRSSGTIDYGFVGDIISVDAGKLHQLLDMELSVVIAPITDDGKGQLLNTNADTIAQEIAKAMSSLYETELIYSFEKEGVLLDASDENSVITRLNREFYGQLKEEKLVFAGMIPKLDNAFAALGSGVSKVIIGKGEKLPELLSGKGGTSIHE